MMNNIESTWTRSCSIYFYRFRQFALSFVGEVDFSKITDVVENRFPLANAIIVGSSDEQIEEFVASVIPNEGNSFGEKA